MKTSKAIIDYSPSLRQAQKSSLFCLQRIRNGWRGKRKPGGSCGKARRGRQLQSLAGISRCCLGRTREKAASTGVSVCLAPSGGNFSNAVFLWWGTSPCSVSCLNIAKRESLNNVKLKRSEETQDTECGPGFPEPPSMLCFPRHVERHSCVLLTFRHDQLRRFLLPLSRERAQRKGNRPLASCGAR